MSTPEGWKRHPVDVPQEMFPEASPEWLAEARAMCDAPVAHDQPAKDALDALTAEQRLEVFALYCTACGRKDARCQCWNDE
jgi:hypothetical protein